ncbi:MAG: hypothetical protein ACKO8Q_06865, partial [Bacteroidota bacterium]
VSQSPILVVEQHALYGVVEGFDLTGYIVHDVFIQFPSNDFRVTAIGAGWNSNTWEVTSNCNFFQQSAGLFSSEESPCSIVNSSDLADYDSRWMIGANCNSNADGILYSMGGNTQQLTNWNNGNFSASNHVLFRLPTDQLNAVQNGRIQIGRFTTCGNICLTVGVQYFENYSGPGSTFNTAQLSGCFDHPCLANPIATSPIVYQEGCSTQSQVVSINPSGNGNSEAMLFNAAGNFEQLVSMPNGLLNLNGLEAGSYFFSIQDEVGCRDTSELFSIPEFIPLSVQESHVNVNCFGGNSGVVQLNFLGGTSPVHWTTGNVNLPTSINNLTSGNYTYLIEDINGCQDSISIYIDEPAELTLLVANQTETSCFNSCDASFSYNVFGGTGQLAVEWNNQTQTTTSGTFSNLCGGYGNIVLSDAVGCVKLFPLEITTPDSIQVSISLTPPLCEENSTGMVEFNFSGGVGNLNVNFEPGSFVEYPFSLTQIQLQNLTPQEVIYSVEDDNNCIVSDTLVVEATFQSDKSFALTSTPETCWNTNDASASIEIFNASGQEQLQWNDDLLQTTATAVGLDGNRTIEVTITDEFGCKYTREVFVPLTDGCIFIAELISPNGDGDND